MNGQKKYPIYFCFAEVDAVFAAPFCLAMQSFSDYELRHSPLPTQRPTADWEKDMLASRFWVVFLTEQAYEDENFDEEFLVMAEHYTQSKFDLLVIRPTEGIPLRYLRESVYSMVINRVGPLEVAEYLHDNLFKPRLADYRGQ